MLPALQSFCIFASVGILAIYFFQCTFFVAWMTLDQKRVEVSRNAYLPCYKHSTCSDPKKKKPKEYSKHIFSLYARILTKPMTKIVVICLIVFITCVAVWGNIRLEQRFDPEWFLPDDTYLARFVVAYKKYFPSDGDRVTIYCSGIDPVNEFEKLNKLAMDIKNQPDIVTSVDSWTFKFTEYYNTYFAKSKHYNDTLPSVRLSYDEFNDKFTQFLYSPTGSKHRLLLNFNTSLECGSPASKMEVIDLLS